MSTADGMATYADLLDLPENVVGELIAGGLYASPRPSPRNANATAVLVASTGPAYHQGRGGPGGWWILFEPELHLGDDVMVPDLAGWRRERLPKLPDTAYFPQAPDWVCEVLSPSTARIDRLLKMPRYAAAGVKHLWLVDPILKTVETFALDQGSWRLLGAYGDERELRAPPFDAVALNPRALWGEDTAGEDSAGEDSAGD